MKLIDGNKVLTMIRRALNMMDRRLVDHGLQVALVLQDMLRTEGRLELAERKRLLVMAMVHDIGASREDEVDRLLEIETRDVWGHAIQGYLFLREYLPDDDMCRVVLYHHADYNWPWRERWEVLHYAQLLHVADRVCILHDAAGRTREQVERHLQAKSGTEFEPEAVKLYLETDRRCGTWENLRQKPCLNRLDDCQELEETEARAYLMILANAIDFRSRNTVIHTRGVMEISLEMARCLGLPEELQQKIYAGALLHDLGKIGIPVSILEKPGRLTEEEMEVMRGHILLGEQIIEGCVDEEVGRIGMRHHERPNGQGYPRGIGGDQLTLPERLLAVADVVSALCMSRSYKEAFPKEKCLGILQSMAESGQLDGDMVALITREFDPIMAVAAQRCAPIQERFLVREAEFQKMLKRYQSAAH